MNKESRDYIDEYAEKRINSLVYTNDQLIGSLVQDVKENRQDMKTVLEKVGGIEEHLKTLNGKTDRTIKRVEINDKKNDLEHKEIMDFITPFKNLKWVMYSILIFVVSSGLSAMFDIPIQEVIRTIKSII